MAGIFSRFIFNNAIFNTDGEAPPTPTTGGASYADYKRYRRYLERLSRRADKYTQSKYVKEIAKVAEKIPVIEVAEPILLEIAKSYELVDTAPIANAIRAQIDLMLLQLEKLENQMREQEFEEELVILLCI